MEFCIDKISFKISPEEIQSIAMMNNNGTEYVRSIDNQLGNLFRIINELGRRQMEIIKRHERIVKYRKAKAAETDKPEHNPETESEKPDSQKS